MLQIYCLALYAWLLYLLTFMLLWRLLVSAKFGVTISPFVYHCVQHPQIPQSPHTVFCMDPKTNRDYFSYGINWLVFITETECVYCAVRTGYVNVIRVNLSLRSAHTVCLCVLCRSENKQRLFPYTALTDWFYNRDGECFLRGRTGSLYIHIIHVMCFWGISEQTAIISLYSINWLVFFNRDGVCLLRGTDWIFIHNSGYVFCVYLRTKSDYFPIQH